MGPGLGLEPYMVTYFRLALSLARARGIFVVLDADALWAVCKDVSIVRGYRRAILTPNLVEFKRLCDAVGIQSGVEEGQKAAMVSKALGGVTVLQKGAIDIIAVDTTGERSWKLSVMEGGVEAERAREIVKVDVQGGLKRCGGQGDVLSGVVGTMMAWGKCYENGAFG
jgi:ATP-dependent NAD(P)H-hydrate dehydratase